VVIGELTVVTVILVIGGFYCRYCYIDDRGAYCSYCDSGDRGTYCSYYDSGDRESLL